MRTTARIFSELVRALIVGVCTTEEAELPVLASAERDASRLSTALADKEGCGVPPSNISLLPGPSKKAFLDKLDQICGQLDANDALFVYFAGHAVVSQGEFYLCCSGSKLSDLQETAVTGTEIDARLRGLAARGIFLALDCCESAGFAENAPECFRSLGTGEYRIVLAASRAGQRSWELPDGAGTLFTDHLIDILLGRAPCGATPGFIYFSDLLRAIQDYVREKMEVLFPNIPAQELVFVGVYSQDPLLFVHRRLTLEKIKLSTARYSPDYVRRRIRKWALGGAAALVFVLTSYYGVLQHTEYAASVGGELQILQGYPRLNGPGYPVHLWTVSYGPEQVSVKGEQAAAFRLVAPLGKPVLPLLDAAMREDFLLARIANEGNDSQARLMALRILDEPDLAPEITLHASLIFPTVATSKDVPRLRELFGSGRSEVRLAAAEALAKLEPAYIFPIARHDLPEGDSFPHEDFLRQLQIECTQEEHDYLNDLLLIDSNVPTISEVIDVAMRSHCDLSATALVRSLGRPQFWGSEDIAHYVQLTGKEEPFRAGVLSAMSSTAMDDVRKNTAIGTLAMLKNTPCQEGFEKYLTGHAWWLGLTAAYALGKTCKEEQFDVEWDEPTSAFTMRLRSRGAQKWALRIDVQDKKYEMAMRFLINVLVDRDEPDANGAMLSLVNKAVDDDVRQRAIVALDKMGGTQKINPAWLDGNNLEVRRAVYEYERRRDVKSIRANLIARTGGADEFYTELLGRTPLQDSDRATLRGRLSKGTEERKQVACVLAMQDDPKEVVGLLSEADLTIRSSASNCVGFHAKAHEILAALEAMKVEFPLEAKSQLRRTIKQKENLMSELLATPAEFREWRLQLFDSEPWGMFPQSLRWWIREQRFEARGTR